MLIESLNNPKIKEYTKLNIKKYRDQEDLFIIEGEHLVEEAKKAGIIKEIFSIDARNDATQVTEQVMAKLSGLNTPPKVLAICEKLKEKAISGDILILDDIQDPGNLGTIIRSALAFGVKDVVVSPNTVDLYNNKTLRATEGMIFKINYLKRDLIPFVNELNDYEIITTDVNNGTNLKDLKINNKFALIMGNEGNGVNSELASLANHKVNIKINNECESLNVGVASSIILYELRKQIQGGLINVYK